MTIKNIPKKQWIKFSIAAILYTACVIWIGNFLWLLGLVVVFDLYITKKVRWAFWKQRLSEGQKPNRALEWLDAGIFALIVATLVRTFFIEAYVIPTPSMEKSLLVGDYLFVSKIAYGPKLPNTPLSIPLVHNHISLFGIAGESYLKWIQNPYKRIAGFGKIKRNDVVVFNFPRGDTVIKNHPEYIDIYQLKRHYGKDFEVWLESNGYKLIARPVDKADNYVKRCVAVPGDKLQIIHGDVYINGEKQVDIPGKEYSYGLELNSHISQSALEKFGISKEDLRDFPSYLPLTEKAYEDLKKLPNVKSITRNEESTGNGECFPFSPTYAHWSADNYGPLEIPEKGKSVSIDTSNLYIYQRIINVYEKNELNVIGDKIYVNGEPATSYTFKMDYYFMMGDNRHNSLDSRYWGFVPEDHVVGKASFIWFSSNKDKIFPGNIRWSRLFKGVK